MPLTVVVTLVVEKDLIQHLYVIAMERFSVGSVKLSGKGGGGVNARRTQIQPSDLRTNL